MFELVLVLERSNLRVFSIEIEKVFATTLPIFQISCGFIEKNHSNVQSHSSLNFQDKKEVLLHKKMCLPSSWNK